MREIKFRAWDKKNKIMLSHNRLFRLDCSNEYPFLGLIGGHYNNFMEKLNVDVDGIMQYTGLTDKNNLIEIYEGDIININGEKVGNVYENENLFEDTTNFIIGRMGTKEWKNSEQEAIKRGCIYAE